MIIENRDQDKRLTKRFSSKTVMVKRKITINMYL